MSSHPHPDGSWDGGFVVLKTFSGASQLKTMGGDGDLNRSRKKNYRKKHKRTPSMYCELSSCSEAFDFKNGVKYIFSNQFVSSGLQETFIMPDELYEAILCLYFPVGFF